MTGRSAMLYYNRKGRYSAEYSQLWKTLVPKSGQASTLQGELVRAIGRLGDEYYRNGNGNWDGGFESFVDLLFQHLYDDGSFDASTLAQIDEDLGTIRAWGRGEKTFEYVDDEDAVDRITDRVVEWCPKHSQPVPWRHDPDLKR